MTEEETELLTVMEQSFHLGPLKIFIDEHLKPKIGKNSIQIPDIIGGSDSIWHVCHGKFIMVKNYCLASPSMVHVILF